MAEAKKDGNYVSTLIAVSSVDGETPVTLYADPTTHRLLVDSAASLTNPMTTGGDIIYGGLAGVPTRLANGTAGQVLTSNGTTLAPSWTSAGAGTVTSVGFTGGLISVATATTTPALTVAGTSGGIVYFSSASTWATSAALAANALVIGGGAGVAPSTTTTGTGVLTALGVNVGTAGAFQRNNDGFNGTIGATTPTTGVFTTLVAGSTTSLLLGTAGSAVGNIGFRNATSGTITLAPVAGALGTVTLTLPAATDTVAVLAASQAFTNKTYNGLTLTSTTGTFTLAAGKTLTVNNTITFTGTDSTTMTLPTTSKTLAANDGSNWTLSSQATGDLITAASATTAGRLADVAVGSVLVSGGVGVAPSYSANPQVTTIELGAATDTTLSRTAAGEIAVEGVRILTTTPKVLSAASYTTDTGTSLNMDNLDQFIVTAQAGALLFNSPGGTLVQGRSLIIRIKDNGTARALTWNAVFRAMGTALPTTTVLSKTLYLGFFYNSTDTKWDLVASAQEA